jgi:DNA-binding transcriptional regulator YiaG
MKQIMRRVRRRFALLHAPSVAVRVALPWYFRWSGLVGLCTVVAVLAWWGGRYAGAPQQAEASVALEQPVAVAQPPAGSAAGSAAGAPAQPGPGGDDKHTSELEAQTKDLRAQLAAAQRQATMDKASQKELTKSLSKAQDEIARLREDLGLYQSSVQASGTNTNGVSVQNFKVERDGGQRYRYRLLLTHKSQRAQDFKGQGLMNVSYERGGKLSTIMLKQGVAGTSVVELRFKYYQQIEGSFQVEEGAVIKKVEFVVFEEGKNVPMLTSAAALG